MHAVEVSQLGGSMTEAKLDRIGYMPEERGLYQDLPLESCLVYLAGLKGLAAGEARARLGPLLERFELDAHRRKKIKALSKGMQQKAQVIHTILHEPELVVVDEPFSGLDPINTQLVVLIVRATERMFRAQHLLSGRPFTFGRYFAALRGTR